MSRLFVLLTLSLVMVSTACADVKVEKTEYKGWRNCYRVSNGEVELIITADVGPRIIRFGFPGGQNLFKEFAEQLGALGKKNISIVVEIASGRLLKILSPPGRPITRRWKSRLRRMV